MLTRADELRQRASEINDHAWCIRWDHPTEYRALTHIAEELVDIANHLPPERATTMSDNYELAGNIRRSLHDIRTHWDTLLQPTTSRQGKEAHPPHASPSPTTTPPKPTSTAPPASCPYDAKPSTYSPPSPAG